jgi:GT2 family glycosyltransferase
LVREQALALPGLPEGPASRRPVVIAILSWNRLALLTECLTAVRQHTDYPHTICVVDQASTDGTREFLQKQGEGLVHLAVPENLGFVKGNNLIMAQFPDHDVVLLNNDTRVQPGWLTALANRAYSAADVGIVGGKLIYPDGRLQEAGGEIFRDGSGRNIGKMDDPERWIYNQVREVDYCSGACLYIRRAVLDRVGFLDERFHPAYWEDTDLCFAAAAAGFRVMYEPAAVVVHLEGGTAGRGEEQQSRARALQEANKPAFMAKWGEALKNRRTSMYDHRRPGGKPQLLVILPFLPMYDKAAGELRWFRTLPILTEQYDVVLLARNAIQQTPYINAVEAMGITVYATDQTRLEKMGLQAEAPFRLDFEALLRANDFRAVIIGFWHVAHQYLAEIRRCAPRAVVVIDSFDLEFVRQRRKADVTGQEADLWEAERIRRLELDMYRRADCVLVVSEADRQRLRAELPGLSVGISADIHPPIPDCPGERRDLLFVGNFGHEPNVDAVCWFCDEIFPRIRPRLPGVTLQVVGNAPPEMIRTRSGPDVVVTGYVPEVDPYYQQARVGVFPLRYGAGMKGKVAKGLAAGLPMVLTSVAAEGMELTDGDSALIADSPEAFTEAVVRLYEDAALRGRLSAAARRIGERLYSLETVRRHWQETFAVITQGRPASEPAAESGTALSARRAYCRLPRRPEIVPNLTIVIPVHNGLALTQQCVESIRRFTEIPYHILIVDNGSTDGTAEWCFAAHLCRLGFPENRGFAAACNAGILETFSEYLILLNNDTVVSPGWAEGLLAPLDQDPRVGLVGPSTNYASSCQQIEAAYTGLEEFQRFAKRLAREERGTAQEADRLVGVCLAARRRLFAEVGLFDERFGLGNYEDDDFCLRVRMAGYRLLWARGVYIHHIGSQTFAAVETNYQRLLARNREILQRKWDLRTHLPDRLRHLLALGPVAGSGARPTAEPAADPDPEELAALAATGEGGQWANILPELERLGARHPASAEVQALWGQALWRCGRRAEAEARLRRAVTLSPKGRAGHSLLAEFYLASGRFHDALESLETVHRLHPTDGAVREAVNALRARLGAGEAVGVTQEADGGRA